MPPVVRYMENREKILRFIIKNKNRKIRIKRIRESLNINASDVSSILKDLKRNSIIEIDRHDRVISKIPDGSEIGTLYTTPSGNGFVKSESSETFFVPKAFIKNAVYKDKVLVVPTITPVNGKNREGIILYVIEHTLKTVIGTFMVSENNDYGFIISDDNRVNFDLYVSKNYQNGAKAYDKVVAEIVDFPYINDRKPYGKIVQVLGIAGEIEVEKESVKKAFGLPEKFPADVQKEASLLNGDKPSDWDISHRTDFREDLIVTIDCDKSKDLDDAISVRRTDNGYELKVYIADVAHYVRPGSAIDREAFHRGNSTYLLNEVIPMLPTILSNNLCSLNPREEKLVLVVTTTLDKNADVIDKKIEEGIMISTNRLNYTEVSEALGGKCDEFISKYGRKIYDMLEVGKELSEKLLQKRINRGSIELNIVEPNVFLDQTGACIDIRPDVRGIANDMIEEFMVLTNEVVAQFFHERNIPFVYRVHDAPFSEKLKDFISAAKMFGVDIDDIGEKDPTPKDIQLMLESINGTAFETPLKLMLLQSMKQAKYSEIMTPHFGLASNNYCHFTSPIRRYPDLMIHRIIKLYLKGSFCNDAIKSKYEKECHEVSKQSSKTERISDNAEREVIRTKIAEYIENNIDKEFSATIHSINKSGMHITLENMITGYIRDKSFVFDKNTFTMSSGTRVYSLGEKITVKPISINKNTKEILFCILK